MTGRQTDRDSMQYLRIEQYRYCSRHRLFRRLNILRQERATLFDMAGRQGIVPRLENILSVQVNIQQV
jgi:hypothetical protein